MTENVVRTKEEVVLSELCPKCGLRMFNHAGRMTKCQKCLHEWYMDTSKTVAGSSKERLSDARLDSIIAWHEDFVERNAGDPGIQASKDVVSALVELRHRRSVETTEHVCEWTPIEEDSPVYTPSCPDGENSQ